MVYVDIISFKFTVSNDLRSSVNLSNIYASCFTYLRTESFIKSESYDELTVCSIETNSLKIVELEKLSLCERKKVIITLLPVTDHCNFTVNLYPITNKPYLFMNSYVLCHFSFCLFVFKHTFKPCCIFWSPVARARILPKHSDPECKRQPRAI